jgi:hypothetical protein
VADTGVVDLHAHFVGLGRSNFNVLDAQLLASFPGYGSFAGDGLRPLSSISMLLNYGGVQDYGGVVSAMLLTFPTVEAIVLVELVKCGRIMQLSW